MRLLMATAAVMHSTQAEPRKPLTKPASQPFPGPRRSARNTVTISGRSGVTPPRLSAGTTLHWARLPPKVMSRNRARTRLPARGEETGHILLRLAREQQYLLDAREVDGGSEHGEVEQRRALVLDRGHPADGHALREEVAQPGGDDDVSRSDLRAVARNELQA